VIRQPWLAALLIVGGIALAYLGITATRRDTIIDIGPFKTTVDRKDVNPITTVLGLAAIAGGIVLIVRDRM
jgi:hypothetical protein